METVNPVKEFNKKIVEFLDKASTRIGVPFKVTHFSKAQEGNISSIHGKIQVEEMVQEKKVPTWLDCIWEHNGRSMSGNAAYDLIESITLDQLKKQVYEVEEENKN